MTGFELIRTVAEEDCAGKDIIIKVYDNGVTRFFSIDLAIPGGPEHVNDGQACLTASNELVYCKIHNQFEKRFSLF